MTSGGYEPVAVSDNGQSNRLVILGGGGSSVPVVPEASEERPDEATDRTNGLDMRRPSIAT